MANRLVVGGGLVLSGPEWEPYAADLLIEDGRIAQVGAPGDFSTVEAERLLARDRLVMPGFINGHMHSHAAVARGASRNWTLEDSLLNGGWMAAERSAELSELCAVLAGAEPIASGCTGVFDLVAQSGGPSVAGLHAAARGYARVGLRAVIAPMVADRAVHEAVPAIGEACGVPPQMASTQQVLDVCREFVETFPSLAGIEPALAPTIAAHCSPELTIGLHDLAVRNGLRMHTHLAESKPQAISGAERFGHSITTELDRLGVLDDSLTVAHAIWVDDADRRLLAGAGVIAVTVPGSNLRLGSGVADTRALATAGVPLAVGSDGANSADALDLMEAVRLTSLMSRVWDRPAARWLSVAETLDAATVGGAAACGWTGVGQIAPGQAADLMLLDRGAAAFTPAIDLPNQVLTAARAADVTDVVIAGSVVMRDRAIVGLDLAAARKRFGELTDELLAQTGAERTQADAHVQASAEALARLRSRPWPVNRLLQTGRETDGC